MLDQGIRVVEAIPAGYIDSISALLTSRMHCNINLLLGSIVVNPAVSEQTVRAQAAATFDIPELTDPTMRHSHNNNTHTTVSITPARGHYPLGLPFIHERLDGPGHEAPLLTRGATLVGRLPFVLERAALTPPPPILQHNEEPTALVEVGGTIHSSEILHNAVLTLMQSECEVSTVRYRHEPGFYPSVIYTGQDLMAKNRFTLELEYQSPEGNILLHHTP